MSSSLSREGDPAIATYHCCYATLMYCYKHFEKTAAILASHAVDFLDSCLTLCLQRLLMCDFGAKTLCSKLIFL